MKPTVATILIGLALCVPLLARTYIIIAPDSSLPFGTVASGLPGNCKNVVLTTDKTKADYVLKADYMGVVVGKRFCTDGPWGVSLTLFNSAGDVIYAKEGNRHTDSIFKAMCKKLLPKN